MGSKKYKQLTFAVSGPTTSTDTRVASIGDTSEETFLSKEMSETSTLILSQNLTSSLLDFLVKHFRTRGSGRVSKTLVEHSSTKYADLQKLENLYYYSLKTLRGSSVTMKDLHSKSSLNRFRTWGIFSNGKCLTADILEFPSVGNECSLLDILEPPSHVPEKYFLSEKQLKWLLEKAKTDPDFRLKLVEQSTADTELDGDTTAKKP